MLAPDGHARLQVYPSEDLWDHDAMVRFVESIRPLCQDITGLPVNLVESARATWDSLREALLWSGLAITALLLALWRRVGDTLIALGPLLLAVLLTQASTVVLPVPFNFGNVIVLPLLLGIGVDSGVHMVSRASQLAGPPGALLATTTARAVLFSALTTSASFGSLAISSHGGVSSLGVLLVIGMLWVLAANLLLLPALLTLRRRGAVGEQSPAN
jgi:predicted RND superfamily exporter protein